MNVVDSSGWLEYFGEGKNADFFAPAIEDTENLLVPVICLYEVFKRLTQQRSRVRYRSIVPHLIFSKTLHMPQTFLR